MSEPVRPAATGDIHSIFELAKTRQFAARWPIAELAAELWRPDSVFLVIPGQAYAIARVAGTEGRLYDIATMADHSGSGRALLGAVLSVMKAKGVTVLTFEVSSSNVRAVEFYKKSGAHPVGRRPKFYPDGSDAVLMDIDL